MRVTFARTISLLFLLLSTVLFAQQDFQGQAIYQTKTTVNFDDFGRRGNQMTEQQKKRVMDMMKNMFEKTYVLDFNRTESTYKEEEVLDTPGAGGSPWRGMMSSFTGGDQYKNVKEKLLLQEQEFFGKQFLVKDSLKTLEWKLGTETKQIGQYTCFKATTTMPVDEMDFMKMRRRGPRAEESKKENTVAQDSSKAESDNPMDDLEVPKFVIVSAWYTPQIPVSTGPAEYHGLPGLILEVQADRTVILCTKIVMNPQEKTEIKRPDTGEVVTREEYNTIMKDKIEEMRQMYGGGRGGRGRRN